MLNEHYLEHEKYREMVTIDEQVEVEHDEVEVEHEYEVHLLDEVYIIYIIV